MITELEYLKAKRIVDEYESQPKPDYIEHIHLDKFDGELKNFEDYEKIVKACEEISKDIDIKNNSDIIEDIMSCELREMDYLPSFCFDKGEAEPDHDNWIGNLYLPYGVVFSFAVCEGDAVEISWSGSIYDTDIYDWKLK